MKKFAVLLAAMFFVATSAYAAPFSDVPRTHWAYDAIQKAVSAGILQGYDGKFHGKRLLNRYQMAVITAKLLDAMKGSNPMPGEGGNTGELKKMIANLEALTIEFADELALLNVKVSTLEDTVAEIKAGGVKTVGKTAGCDEQIGFTAFAAFALVTDDQTASNRVRYSGTDSTYFTLPQVSVGVDKEVNPGVYFHAQFDYASEVNAGAAAGRVGVNQAYFFVDELFGDIGGKIGGFAAPFSMEHNGPFRTCNLTISPSVANSWHDTFRYYGLELQKTKDVQPDDIIWKFGIVSGSDALAPGYFVNDAPIGLQNWGGEADEGFGFYLYIGKKPEKSGDFGWNFSYMDNGGDATAATGTPSPETDFWQLGFEWSNDDFLVMFQYLDGSTTPAGATVDADFNTFYLLLNYKIDEKASITLRYDSWENGDGGANNEGTFITLGYNRKVTDNSILQFEYVTPDDEVAAGADDPDDDQIQLRYKVHF